MSFGYSIGDVIVVAKLACDVYNAYQDAPGSFRNISYELGALHIIMAREKDRLENRTLDPADQEELRKILQGCESVLRDLDNLLIKYKRLAGEGSVAKLKFVARVRFGFEDISELRARLVSNTLLFNTFITRGAMDEMKDLITNGARIPGLRHRFSISSLASFAPGSSSNAVWKKHYKDLHEAGVTADIIRQRGPQVLAFLQSGSSPVEGSIDSQHASTSQTSILQHNTGEPSKEGAEGKSDSTILPSNGALPGPSNAQHQYLHGHRSRATAQPDGSRIIDSQSASTSIPPSNGGLPLASSEKNPPACEPFSAVTSQASRLDQNEGELSKQGAKGKSGNTTSLSAPSLIAAAAAGDADRVRELLKVFQDLDDRVTALHIAADYGHAEVMRLVLEQGANIEAAKSDDGSTALNAAAYHGHADVVKLLLEKGANIEAVGSNKGWTALIASARYGYADVVKLLLEKGANIEAARSDDGSTALANAAYAGHADVVRLLLEKGANTEATRSTHGGTALNSAAYGGHTDVVRLLLEKGANIEAARSNDGSTALDGAAYAGHADIVRLLLEKGASIEAARSDDGSTALDNAAYGGHAGIVRLLLEKGANIEAARSDGFTALHTAAYAGHADVVRLLFDKGASLDARTCAGSTALLLAAKKAHREVVSLLLEKGACPRLTNKSHNTALHVILQNAGDSGDSWKQRIPTISLLLEHGANILHRNNRGQTPLSLAEASGFLDLKQLALKHTKHDSTLCTLDE